MLNSGEIQTFLDLIKGLNESLRTLATKVELMERNSSSTAVSYNELQKEMALVAQRTEKFREFMDEISDFNSIHGSEIDKLNTRLASIDTNIHELRGSYIHIDNHLDANESVLSDLKGQTGKACDSVNGVGTQLIEIKDVVKPLSSLVSAVKKPIAIVIVIYILVSSLIGLGQMVGTLAAFFGSKTAVKDPAPQQVSKVSDVHGLKIE